MSGKLVPASTIARVFSVDESTVSRWASSGKIPCLRVGTTVRFDLDSVIDAIDGGNGSTRDGRGLGARMASSPAMAGLRSRMSGGGTALPEMPDEPISLASAGDLAVRLRGQLDPTTGSGLVTEDYAHRRVQVAPAVGSVLALVPAIPVATLEARSAVVSVDVDAPAGTDPGTARAVASGVTVTTAPVDLRPWGISADLSRTQLADAGVLSATVDKILRRGWAAKLSRELVTGTGADTGNAWEIEGIANVSGVATVDGSAAADAVAAVESAVQGVQSNGYGLDGSALAVVGSPATLGRLRAAARPGGLSELLPVRPVVQPGLADGTLVVGDFTEGSAIFLGPDGLTAAFSPYHGSNFLTGTVTALFEAQIGFAADAAGFAVVAGL